MPARHRAHLDEQAGDLGMARRRLISLAMSEPFDPELFEEIARLSVRMGDLTEAGRWYFVCDSQDDVAADCMARFLRSCGNKMEHAVLQLPLKRKIPTLESIPPAVRERLAATPAGAAIIQRAGSVSANKPVYPKPKSLDHLLSVGCFTAIALVVIFTVLGLIATVRFIISLW